MKYVLVTGADHGLGFALVQNLLNRGYFVVACRLNAKEQELDKLQEQYPNQLLIQELDIGSDDSVSTMKENVSKAVPHLDLLINSAGILGEINKTLGDDLDYDEMLQVFNVNAVGTLRVTNALTDLLMKSDSKTVLNISSEAGSIKDCEREGWFGYCMSKAANNMQSALVHNNIKKHGGRVIAMHPGHVATFMRGHLDTTAVLTPDESAKAILKTVLDTELPVEERPVYINYCGERLPW